MTQTHDSPPSTQLKCFYRKTRLFSLIFGIILGAIGILYLEPFWGFSLGVYESVSTFTSQDLHDSMVASPIMLAIASLLLYRAFLKLNTKLYDGPQEFTGYIIKMGGHDKPLSVPMPATLRYINNTLARMDVNGRSLELTPETVQRLDLKSMDAMNSDGSVLIQHAQAGRLLFTKNSLEDFKKASSQYSRFFGLALVSQPLADASAVGSVVHSSQDETDFARPVLDMMSGVVPKSIKRFSLVSDVEKMILTFPLMLGSLAMVFLSLQYGALGNKGLALLQAAVWLILLVWSGRALFGKQAKVVRFARALVALSHSTTPALQVKS